MEQHEIDRRLIETIAKRLVVSFGHASVLVSRLTDEEQEALKRNEPILIEAVAGVVVGVGAVASVS